MTRHTDIHLEFADGEYCFALLLPQTIELEKNCGSTDADGFTRRKGLIAIFSDVAVGLAVLEGKIIGDPLYGRASAFECREVIRLALIGGGKGVVNGAEIAVNAVKARELCEAYVDNAPVIERWTLAAAILRAAVEGPPQPKKDEPAKAPARPRAPRKTKASTLRG